MQVTKKSRTHKNSDQNPSRFSIELRFQTYHYLIYRYVPS